MPRAGFLPPTILASCLLLPSVAGAQLVTVGVELQVNAHTADEQAVATAAPAGGAVDLVDCIRCDATAMEAYVATQD